MSSPPGNADAALAKRRRGKLTGLSGAYYFAPILQACWFERFLRLLQWPFGFVFWELERAIANIDIEQERRRT